MTGIPDPGRASKAVALVAANREGETIPTATTKVLPSGIDFLRRKLAELRGGVAAMNQPAFRDRRKWWIFRDVFSKRWIVCSPEFSHWPIETIFPTGAEAIAAFARGAA